MELLGLLTLLLITIDASISTGESADKELTTYLMSEYPTEFKFSEGLSVLRRTA